MRWLRKGQDQERDERDSYLSVVIIFYNMRREAARTLFSLTPRYQQDISEDAYEVIAIDSGSTQPLDAKFVESFGKNFRYEYFKADSPSPCAALNYGARIAKGKWITLFIDGARIPSPGVLHYSLLASKLYEDPFIYTLGMHIGHKQQNFLAEENYAQLDEDKLLGSIDWQQDGYLLFDISSVALSSKEGFFSKLTESNCVTISKKSFQQLGGFNEKFISPGGGLSNLDFFNRANENADLQPIMLLGEATFHQFHNGTATNVPLKDHPWEKMAQEYLAIRGKSFAPHYRRPAYFGTIHPQCYRLIASP
jgi:glycosyltransferase involved in cell wall biosynthesis